MELKYKHDGNNKCPVCGSTNIEWGVHEMNGEGEMVQKPLCNVCSFQWDAYYKLVFDGSRDTDNEPIVVGKDVNIHSIDDSYQFLENIKNI